MNQVVQQRAAPPAAKSAATRAEKIQASFAASERKYVQAVGAAERDVVAEGWYRSAARSLECDGTFPRRFWPGSADDVAEATRLSTTLPADATATSSALAVAELIGPSEPDATRLLIAMLLGSFPHQAKDPETLYEAIVHHVNKADVSPAVLAVAIDRLVATTRFAPAVSEVLEACIEVRHRLATHLRKAKRANELRAAALACLEQAKERAA